MIYRIVIGIVGLWLSACKERTLSDPMAHIQNQKVREVLTQAIESAGGWASWTSLEQISYDKRSILYHADGSVERDVKESHAYRLLPALSGEISWEEDGNVNRVVFAGDTAFQEINGVLKPDSGASAYRTFMSAYYVLFIPFKLLDPGAQLTYEGKDTLDGGLMADVIKASYPSVPDDQRNTHDDWWYFFDHENGNHMASLVYHAPTYAFIENIEVSDNQPIRFNTYRKSYRVDSAGIKQYLRGEFYYSAFTLWMK